jgi:hypothetical protein
MWNQDNQRKSVVLTNRKFILAVFFVFALTVGFGLGKVDKAKADGYCMNVIWEETQNREQQNIIKVKDEATCLSYCSSDGSYPKYCNFTTTLNEATAAAKEVGGTTSVCDFSFSRGTLSSIFNCLLLVILNFLASLLEMASTLFIWILDANNIKSVMSNSIVYNTWALVRDSLNIAFILVLLFSAFCTVFQVQKYNYKNILLTLIIMALLVNFSFPIARVIIDFSNVIMYYFIKNLGFQQDAAGSYFANIANRSQLQYIVNPPNNVGADTSFLIAAVVFTFILAVTFLIIAILFLIRLIVLTLLIIFSSIAFVGSIVPFLSSQASKWWDTLFKYSFFGPIMIFMIIVASRMMSFISTSGLASMQNIANKNTSDPTFIASVAFFSIPIVILWIGIGFAQQMSIAGASAVVGRGQKFMGWAGSTFSGWRAATYGYKKAGEGAKYGVKAAWNAFDRGVLAKGIKLKSGKRIPLSWRVWKKAWLEGTKEIDERKYGDAEAEASDILSSVFKSRRKIPNYHKRKREAIEVAKYRKEQESIGKSDEKCITGLRALETAAMDQEEKKKRAIAYFETLEEGRNLNEAIKKMLGPINASAAPAEIEGLLNRYGITGTDNTYHRERLGEMAVATGDYHLFNLDENNIATRQANLRGKLNTVDNQNFQIRVHPEAVFIKDANGNLHGTQGDAEVFIDHLLASGGDYLNRNRGGFSKDVLSDAGIRQIYDRFTATGDNKYKDFLKLVANKHTNNTGNQTAALNDIQRVTGWTP